MRAVILATVLLSGCVLHSKTPIYGEVDAVPVLGTKALNFKVATRDNGIWMAADNPVARIVPEGRHYVLPDPATPKDLSTAGRYFFIPLGGQRYLIEAVAGGEADYAVATWDGITLLVSAMDCDALKSGGKAGALVTFKDDDCSLIPDGVQQAQALVTLSELTGPPTLRFTRR